MQFCDAATGGVVSQDKVFATAGQGMASHAGGPLLFASALDASIRLWDSRTGRSLLSLQGHTAPIWSLSLTPDGSTLVSSDASGVVLAWDLTYYNDTIRRELEYRAAHGGAP